MPQQIESVTLDGSGNGLVRLPQAPLMRYWVYNRISISIDSGVAGAVTGAECAMYKGEPSSGNFVTSSRLPWADTAGFDPISGRLTSPEYFTFRFTGCDPGGVATVVADFSEAAL